MKRTNNTFIRLRSGRKFWPLDPRPEDVDVRDVAFGLAGQFRYAGHSRLTVAQHSVVGSYYCDEPLAFLFHDASEGLGLLDFPHPIKHAPEFAIYLKVEERIMKAVNKRFGLPWKRQPWVRVKTIDDAMGVAERTSIVWPNIPMSRKSKNVLPLTPDQKRVWSPEEAERRFLERYAELSGERVEGAEIAVPLAQANAAKIASRIISAGLAAPERPAGSFTQAELAAELGVSLCMAKKRIAQLAQAGKVKPVSMRILQSNGRVTTTTGWQLKEGVGE